MEIPDYLKNITFQQSRSQIN